LEVALTRIIEEDSGFKFKPTLLTLRELPSSICLCLY